MSLDRGIGQPHAAKRKADKRAVAESFDLVTREWLASLAQPPVLPKNAKRRRRRAWLASLRARVAAL